MKSSGYAVYRIGNEEVSKQVVDGPFGSDLKVSEYVSKGVPLVRVSNCRTGQIQPDNELVYISAEKHSQIARSEVLPGDVLLTKAGSLGYSVVFPKELEKGNITSHLASIRPAVNVEPQYLSAFLTSRIGIQQIYRWGNKTTRPELNTDEVRAIKIVLPPLQRQKELAAITQSGQERRYAKLRKADELVTGMDIFVLERLGLVLEPLSSKLTFAVKRSDIKNSELYCRPTYPGYLYTIHALKNSKWYQGELENYVQVNPRTDNSGLQDSDIVSFVPMTAVGNKDNTVNYESRTYNEVKIGYTVFQRNDLLWAKITPCMQNGKSCIMSEMPTEIGFGSTEFHVLRNRSDKVYMPYIWTLLSNNIVLQAAQAVFTGSAGQQRVSDSFLKKFPLPLPDIALQKEIANSVFAMLERVYTLKREAEAEWAAAKTKFEQELLGGMDK